MKRTLALLLNLLIACIDSYAQHIIPIDSSNVKMFEAHAENSDKKVNYTPALKAISIRASKQTIL